MPTTAERSIRPDFCGFFPSPGPVFIHPYPASRGTHASSFCFRDSVCRLHPRRSARATPRAPPCRLPPSMSQQGPRTQGVSGSPEGLFGNGKKDGVPKTIEIPSEYVAGSVHHLSSINEYKSLYKRSIENPCSFWTQLAQTDFFWKDWIKKRDELNPILDANFTPSELNPVRTTFAKGCTTNISYNCVDRHVEAGRERTTAILFEPNDPNDTSSRSEITYGELLVRVKDFAAALRARGVRAGDVVTIYMPMVPDLPVAMLACARIGAVHSVVFGGFSAESLAGRIRDAQSTCVVTCDGVYRGSKLINLKSTVDAAVEICGHASQSLPAVEVYSVIVLERVGREVSAVRMVSSRDVWWSDAVAAAAENMISDAVEWVDSEHPLFILYTSGSTGKPKGIQHATGGYMVYTAATFKYTFNYQPGDVFFCTADCGWITGHSYVTYGPMLNGATQVVFEGIPNFPDAGRLWDITDRYNVNILYTAPTALRALKRAGDHFVTAYSRKSLKVLGSVGEPINPEAYMWYYNVVGGGRCAIVDTWWQTETGGFCITPLPVKGIKMKPGCAMMPFLGIEPALLNEKGEEVTGVGFGYLVIKKPWPSILRSIFGDHKRMEEVYFTRFPGYYMTGDGARRDEDGHYYLTGRVDDVLNVSGHRLGTAEIESALVLHPAVVEAAVVGVPHDIKGEDIYAFVTLLGSVEGSDELRTALKVHVRKEIGPVASLGTIHWAPALPKTRSGKIMRRILRLIAKDGKATNPDDLGDTSTLADESVVDQLIKSHES